MEGRGRVLNRMPSLDDLRGTCSVGNPYQSISMNHMSDRTGKQLPEEDYNMSSWPRRPQALSPIRQEQRLLEMEGPADGEVGSRAITPHLQENDSKETITNKQPTRARFPWVVSLLVVVPITLPTAVLLVLVRTYRVKSEHSIFDSPNFISSSEILVEFADTRLVLVASFLNNIVGPLAGWIMCLYAPKVVRALRLGATDPNANMQLQPNPYQMTLLGGICQASSWQQFMLFRYRTSRQRRRSKTRIAPTLLQASKLMCWLNSLRLAFFVAIIALHLTVSTIAFDRLYTAKQEPYSPGFRISEQCLEGNVFGTFFPCTWNILNPNLAAQLREQYFLQHQVSNIANIRSVDDSNIAPQVLTVLTPGTEVVPANIDFRATSIGVSTECSFITPACEMRYMAALPDPDTYKTLFNCSDAFYGVLGVVPKLADAQTTAGDSTVPDLCFKPSAILQIGYFVDPSLTLVYNPVGYDPTTLSPLLAFGPLPESDLVPVLYQAVTARVPLTGIGNNVTENSNVFAGQHSYAEFSMRCQITTYDVEYSRVKGTLQNTTSVVSQNGSVLELFHGIQFYNVVSDSQLDVQDMLARVSWQSSTDGLRREWEQLMSLKVMSAIGSVAHPAEALMQQSRKNMLVAKVPWLSLVLLCAVTVLQVALGTQVIVSTYWRSTLDLRDQKGGKQLSTAGASWSMFQDAAVSELSMDYAPDKCGLPIEDLKRADASRVIVAHDLADHLQLVLVKATT